VYIHKQYIANLSPVFSHYHPIPWYSNPIANDIQPFHSTISHELPPTNPAPRLSKISWTSQSDGSSIPPRGMNNKSHDTPAIVAAIGTVNIHPQKIHTAILQFIAFHSHYTTRRRSSRQQYTAQYSLAIQATGQKHRQRTPIPC